MGGPGIHRHCDMEMATIQAPNSPSKPVQDTNAHIRQEGNKGTNKAGMHMHDPDQASQCLYAPHTSQNPPTVELSHPASHRVKPGNCTSFTAGHENKDTSRSAGRKRGARGKATYTFASEGKKKEARGVNIHTLPPRRRRANPIRKGLISQ
ncbi:hypothetical protein PoB_007449400 [Plakobranchus ocellatus]|uniref:Uncharacterized protein n=1 Tax=Plakobranchus ocellatus TaxID=259542 RepID=A0AAV4DV09_9GAST|nr:hypothetical protein PoB_007449400 [Plakobranchus ocellatus]